MFRDVTGIILAGGKSSRMGRDKALLKIGNLTAIEIICKNLKSIFNEVIIIANEAEKYSFLDLKIYEDKFKNIGPIAGIHSGLINSSHDKNFFISCDMVLINREIIEHIVNYPSEKLIKIPMVQGMLQPLCAVYSRKIIPCVERMIKDCIDSNRKELCSLLRLVDLIDSEIIEMEKQGLNITHNFLSMNDDSDYQKVIQVLGTHQNT